jgi:hypothetical protein
MDTQEHIDGRDMIHMMYGNECIETFKALWEQDKGLEKWSQLLHSCYWELSYTRAGGDEGYLDNPPINVERIKYLEELVAFLEGEGIRATHDAP